jgi:hypothetical protein
MFGQKSPEQKIQERKAREDREWERQREEEAAHRRKQDGIRDKTPSPTLKELLAMEMSEELPVLNYRPGRAGQAWNEPGMRTVGHVCRVPGGWIYQFIHHSTGGGMTSQFIPIGGA